MDQKHNNAKIVTLQDISQHMKSGNLDNQILLFDVKIEEDTQQAFPLYFDSLVIILVRSGEGVLGIDLIEHEVNENSIIILQPKNYVFLSKFSENCHAEIIACSHEIVEEIMPKLTDILPLMLQHRADPVQQFTRESADRIHEYYQFIKRQLEESTGPYRKQKIIRLLQAALYEVMDQEPLSIPEMIPHTRKNEIMARFILAVTDQFREERSVSYYADKLCITPKHLSAVVKSVSGRTAGEWIDNYVVMEAKVLLKTTDYSIKEISDKLNFKNQSFFGKFFKHLTGTTPTLYRKKKSNCS